MTAPKVETITTSDFRDVSEMLYGDGSGPFNGYDAWGYIGNDNRNYLTDVWVIAGANDLGWSLFDLAEWMTSADGRHTLDREPESARAMRDLMARVDVDALVEGAAFG